MAAFGLLSAGAYIPRNRMSRQAIFDAVGWAQGGLKSLAKGHRAFGAWDEDPITMAIAAARTLSSSTDLSGGALCFASTTAPFLDRQNASVVAVALDAPKQTHCFDMAGSQRAATSALVQLSANTRQNAMLVAADKRPVKPASALEMLCGDGAAALLIGTGAPIAEFVGTVSTHADFVDHYRTAASHTDYSLEDRWLRDEGLVKIVPNAISRLLEETGMAAGDIDHLVCTVPNAAHSPAIARAIGVDPARLADALFDQCGHTGAAHPLLQLTHTFGAARPGDTILLIGFGQGCDAVLMRVTENIASHDSAALPAILDDSLVEENYTKFLASRGAIDMEWGMRAERDNRTAQTVAYDKSRDLYGLIGGYCEACETPQFPQSRRCVNPACNALDRQRDYRFADQPGIVKSYTEDWMAFTREPPLIYGNVAFEGGGNLFIEMCGFAPGEVSIGTPVAMNFRIKDIDDTRGFHRYFWKAGPVRGGVNA